MSTLSTPVRPLHILVADDNPINLRLATRILREMGHTGALVTDGIKALKALDAQRFDVVLLDVTMPEMDGVEVLGKLRDLERQGRPKTTVIMVTAHDLPSDRKNLLAAGADGFVPKPLEAAALASELARVLR
jgi:CheY-like chemotaxis protein